VAANTDRQYLIRVMPAKGGTMHIVVAGGGLIGLAVAWRARQQGMAVTVCDPAPGRGASWAAAGMLAPVTEVHYGEEALLQLNLASAQRYPSFAAELADASGRDPGYRRCGALLVARDQDDHAALTELHAFQERLGLSVQRLRSREARELEPGLAPSVRSGIVVEDDHQVDNRALVEALLAACARSGVQVVAELVTQAHTPDHQFRAVQLLSGRRIEADALVLATGWQGQLQGLPSLPLRPVKGQLLHLHGPADPPIATRLIRGLECYVVPRGDGRVVVGATVEERGLDSRVTAGGVHALLRAARELLPDIDELELVEATSGLRPGTPDNAPLIGPTEVDGVLAAAGHYRNGVLLAPITADVVVETLTSGVLPAVARPFSPDRFTGARVR
jgi:glycine oxidase